MSGAGRFKVTSGRASSPRPPRLLWDQLIATYGEPIFCKIDVEGYEPLRARGALGSARPTLPPEFVPSARGVAHACVARLETAGLLFFALSLGETLELGGLLDAGGVRIALDQLRGQASPPAMSMRFRLCTAACSPTPTRRGRPAQAPRCKYVRVVDSANAARRSSANNAGTSRGIEHAMRVEGGVRAADGNREVQSPADGENSLQLQRCLRGALRVEAIAISPQADVLRHVQA